MVFKGRIYIHKNKINGKCYVGQTISRRAAYSKAKKGKHNHACSEDKNKLLDKRYCIKSGVLKNAYVRGNQYV